MLDEVEDDHDDHGAHLQPGGSWLGLSIDLAADGNLSRPWLLCIPQSQPWGWSDQPELVGIIDNVSAYSANTFNSCCHLSWLSLLRFIQQFCNCCFCKNHGLYSWSWAWLMILRTLGCSPNVSLKFLPLGGVSLECPPGGLMINLTHDYHHIFTH